MLVKVRYASKLSEDISKTFGRDYYYDFWNMKERVSLVSDKPFSRNSVARIEQTSQDNIWSLEIQDETSVKACLEDGEKLGTLVLASSGIPLSEEVDYSYVIKEGDAKILYQKKTEPKGSVCGYLLMVVTNSPIVRIEGTDQTYGDVVEFTIKE